MAMRENGYAVPGAGEPVDGVCAVEFGDAKVNLTSVPGEGVGGRATETKVVVRVGTFDREDNRRAASRIMSAIYRRLHPHRPVVLPEWAGSSSSDSASFGLRVLEVDPEARRNMSFKRTGLLLRAPKKQAVYV